MLKQAGSLQEWSIVRLPDGRVGTLKFFKLGGRAAFVQVSDSLSVKVGLADELELIVSSAVGMRNLLHLQYMHLVIEGLARAGAPSRGVNLKSGFSVRYVDNDEVYVLGDYGYCLWRYDRGWSLGFWSEAGCEDQDEHFGNPLRHDVPLEDAIEAFLGEIAEKQTRPPAPDAHLESAYEDRVCGDGWD